MPNSLEREYRRARKASLVGAVVMYAIAVLSLGTLILYLGGLLGAGVGDAQSASWWALSITVIFLFLAANLLLGRFFWCFGRDQAPFGRGQSLKLCVAGSLFAVKLVLESLVPASGPIEAVTEGMAFVPRPGFDLETLTIVAFLLCLALVVRYGDALKRDSDSIA